MSTAEPPSPERQAAARARLDAAFEELGAAIQEAERMELDPSEYLDPGKLMALMGVGA